MKTREKQQGDKTMKRKSSITAPSGVYTTIYEQKEDQGHGVLLWFIGILILLFVSLLFFFLTDS